MPTGACYLKVLTSIEAECLSYRHKWFLVCYYYDFTNMTPVIKITLWLFSNVLCNLSTANLVEETLHVLGTLGIY